jgi:hypothetical protein
MTKISIALILFLTLPGVTASATPWQVGIAKTDITPRGPIWLAGYAARNHPAEGTLHPLWAKALVIQDAEGGKVAILTTDLIGLPGTISEAVAKRIETETGITRDRLLMNFSHTHSGPVIDSLTDPCYGLTGELKGAAAEYTRALQDKLVAAVLEATKKMQPANLAFGQGEAAFAINRRSPRDGGYIIAPNPAGPVDHAVPVLRVTDQGGRLMAVLFGYACHNTTLSGYEINGDYAGFAQVAVEKTHPDATALFMIGCGGDQNPEPRGKIELAEAHGRALAGAVEDVLKGEMTPVAGPLRTAFAWVELPLVDPPSKEELLKRRGQGDIYHQRTTEHLLSRLDTQGSIMATYRAPLGVIRFGDSLTVVALPGETVVDYALRLRKEYPGERLWIAGYSNDVSLYLPSDRVLAEGGYEGGGAMVYYGIHGPFKPGVEERVVEGIKKLIAKCAESGRR